MGVTLTGIEVAQPSWWQRVVARWRPTPTRPPSYHASRTANVRPGSGGRHRCTTGVLRQEQLPSGWIVTFRRRP